MFFVFSNSKCGGMATHAGLALELGITRKKSLSPQMEAILIWCQCRTREYDDCNIQVKFSTSQDNVIEAHSSHSPFLGFYTILGWRPSILCTYPQFLPQCIRLQILENRITCRQTEKLWACFYNWREVRRSSWLSDSGGHVRNGGGEEDWPQDGVLLCPGGLQNVQRVVECFYQLKGGDCLVGADTNSEQHRGNV